jgi:hypothetical protein
VKKVYNKYNKTIKGDRNMIFNIKKILKELENQELSYYKIIFNYDILNDEDNNFRKNAFSNVLAETGYSKNKYVDTLYEKNLKNSNEADLKKEFKQEVKDLKEKLEEITKEYNKENHTDVGISYRFDLSIDNENGKIK